MNGSPARMQAIERIKREWMSLHAVPPLADLADTDEEDPAIMASIEADDTRWRLISQLVNLNATIIAHELVSQLSPNDRWTLRVDIVRALARRNDLDLARAWTLELFRDDLNGQFECRLVIAASPQRAPHDLALLRGMVPSLPVDQERRPRSHALIWKISGDARDLLEARLGAEDLQLRWERARAFLEIARITHDTWDFACGLRALRHLPRRRSAYLIDQFVGACVLCVKEHTPMEERVDRFQTFHSLLHKVDPRCPSLLEQTAQELQL